MAKMHQSQVCAPSFLPGAKLTVPFSPNFSACRQRQANRSGREKSDFELLAATARGRSNAFTILYARYERRIYQYIRTFVRQPAIAEEVVIDTMMAIWSGAHAFGRNSRVSTWILGIARHKAIDAVRKIKNHSDHGSIDSAGEIEDFAEPPLAAVDRTYQKQFMLRAIAHLSPDHQEILRLAFYEGLAYEEIAAFLSIPDNTVKSRVFYAKQRLKVQLKKIGVQSALD
jgi:RNA polymerase sigma-70 factor, ECF subfamily